MKGNRLILIPLLCLFIIRCSPDNGPGDSVQIDVKEDVILTMLPSLNPAGSGLAFSFRSNADYHCDDVGFTYTLKTTSDDIGIHLLGLHFPDVCDGVNSPAVETILVPGNDGSYTVAIDIGEVIHNSGLLQIEGETYKLYLNSTDGMTVPYTIMNKIPEGTIWGFVKASNSGQQGQILDQVKVLMDPYTDAAALTKGYYGYFSVSSPVGINVLYPELAFSTSSFAYHFLGDGDAIGSLADEIRQALPAGTDFRIYTWEGKTY